MLRKIVADVLIELELSLNPGWALLKAASVNDQGLRQRLPLRVFEQLTQSLIEAKRRAGVRHKKTAQRRVEPPAGADHSLRREAVRHDTLGCL